MQFVPLAMSKMGEHGTCVAGVDLEMGQWIRPVVSGHSCLFEKQTAEFEANYVHELSLGSELAVSPRSSSYHSEDRIFHGVISADTKLSAEAKIRLLDDMADANLELSLLAGNRSIFLVKPQDFTYRQDSYGKARIDLSGFPSSQQILVALTEHGIGCSGTGIRCTCPRWNSLTQQLWPGRGVTLSMIREYAAGADVYLAMSLGRLYHDKYWVMAAGVHIVGEDKIWL